MRISYVQSWRKRHLLRQPILERHVSKNIQTQHTLLHAIITQLKPQIFLKHVQSFFSEWKTKGRQTLLLVLTSELHSITVITGVVFRAWKRCRIRRQSSFTISRFVFSRFGGSPLFSISKYQWVWVFWDVNHLILYGFC